MGGHAGLRPAGDRRDRGQALLPPRRRGLQRHRPRGDQERDVGKDRPGRIDDHPAARPRALHQGPEARRRPKDPRGEDGRRAREGPQQAVDPRAVPERRAVRHGARAHRDRGRGGVAGLLQPLGQGPDARPGGAARRPSPGAVRLQPVPESRRRPPAPQRGAPGDGEAALHLADRRQPCLRAAARATAHDPLRQPPRAVLLRLRAGPADLPLRRERLPPGRPQDLHDRRSEAPGRGPEGDRRDPQLPERPELGHRLDRSAHGLHQGDGVERDLPEPRLQPRRAGAPAAGLGLQGDGAHHRAPPGGRPEFDLLRLEAAVAERSRLRPLEGQDLRRDLRRPDEPRHGHAEVGQHRLRAARHRRRPEERGQDRAPPRHPHEARRDPLRGARRAQAGRLATRDGERLRHAFGRGDLQRAEGDHEGRVPGREDR